MSLCARCGAMLVGTAENPPEPGMCVYCERDELRRHNNAATVAAKGAIVTLEAWAEQLGKDPCNNDNYCRLRDWLRTQPPVTRKVG